MYEFKAFWLYLAMVQCNHLCVFPCSQILYVLCFIERLYFYVLYTMNRNHLCLPLPCYVVVPTLRCRQRGYIPTIYMCLCMCVYVWHVHVWHCVLWRHGIELHNDVFVAIQVSEASSAVGPGRPQ